MKKKKGIYRIRSGKGFRFKDERGKVVTSSSTLSWIRTLAIPPAWEEVWISASQGSSLLATGRDAKNRKQYRYHQNYRRRQDEAKYTRILSFGRALPMIRKTARRDIKAKSLSRRKVLSAVILLLEQTRIRVGNEEYARVNHSYGLTTLQDKHVRIEGNKVIFRFVGKSGKAHEIELVDKSIAAIVKRCRELPGPDLFQYVDEHGVRHDVTSVDVNEYLREITNEDFSAKDFRTWSGTVLAALALQEFKQFDSSAHAKRNIKQAIESVAKDLGNTPTICKNCYIHPAIVSSYLDGSLIEQMKKDAGRKLRKELKGLTAEEGAVLAFLEERLKKESRKLRKKRAPSRKPS